MFQTLYILDSSTGPPNFEKQRSCKYFINIDRQNISKIINNCGHKVIELIVGGKQVNGKSFHMFNF